MENVLCQMRVQKMPERCCHLSEELEGPEAAKIVQRDSPKDCPCSSCSQMSSGCSAFQEDETGRNFDPDSLEGIHRKTDVQTKDLLYCKASVTHQKVNSTLTPIFCCALKLVI